MTIRELIKSALRAIGAIDPHITPTEKEMSDALEALNLMLESWHSNSLLVYVLTEYSHVLVANDAEYTIGSGGDFNTTRPFSIMGGFIRSGDIDYPLDIIGGAEYNSLSDKAISSIPTMLNYLPESPLGKIRLFPAPYSAYYLHIQNKTPLAEITDLNTAVSLEPGYKAAIKWNLAVEIAPEWDVDVSQVVAMRAQDTLDNLMIQNAARAGIEPIKLNLFGEGNGTYNSYLSY